MKNLLEVKNLNIAASKLLVQNVNFTVRPGEIVGIVGESGSGKSMTALSLLGLLPAGVQKTTGTFLWEEKETELRPGIDVSMIFQEPMTSLNPVLTIRTQMEEMLSLHEKTCGREEREKRISNMLEKVGLPEQVKEQYPHQLSGGMRQRVMIGMAMLCKPKLLIADEPTTALDVKVQEQILQLIQELSQDYKTAVLFISHDIKLVHRFCHHVFVMKSGEIVERGDSHQVFHHPEHPYTKQLLDALPKPKELTTVSETKTVLKVTDLSAGYDEKQVLTKVSFELHEGEILGIMGESGCGKSTLSQCLTGLLKPTGGTIELFGHRIGMVFQDPYSSLNPAKTVGWLLQEPLRIQKVKDRSFMYQEAVVMLDAVGFSEEYMKRRIQELSGGQRQRIAIALALMTRPEIVILDEPVSALDVTIQDKVCKLLLECKELFGLSYIFISHDQEVMKMMCDRTLQMNGGKCCDH